MLYVFLIILFYRRGYGKECKLIADEQIKSSYGEDDGSTCITSNGFVFIYNFFSYIQLTSEKGSLFDHS